MCSRETRKKPPFWPPVKYKKPKNFLKFICLFIYFEREKERGRGRERERERERMPSRLHAVSTEPSAGLELTNCEIMT